ncbi:hypothetical protein [uncultured Jatrophihabitans sp.]|uniref:hypothetical protein n=1 Tax=uncultured Jatrophihabitans sp. TaxID=1610747 RepID=UPI0035CB1648
MANRYEETLALRGARRLHRSASVLVSVLTAIFVVIGIVGIALIAAGVADQSNRVEYLTAGIAALVGPILSSLPVIVFGHWAQAYALDLQVRMTRTDEDEEFEDDPSPRRRPGTLRATRRP